MLCFHLSCLWRPRRELVTHLDVFSALRRGATLRNLGPLGASWLFHYRMLYVFLCRTLLTNLTHDHHISLVVITAKQDFLLISNQNCVTRNHNYYSGVKKMSIFVETTTNCKRRFMLILPIIEKLLRIFMWEMLQNVISKTDFACIFSESREFDEVLGIYKPKRSTSMIIFSSLITILIVPVLRNNSQQLSSSWASYIRNTNQPELMVSVSCRHCVIRYSTLYTTKVNL